MLDKRKSRLGNVTINQQEYMLFEEIGRVQHQYVTAECAKGKSML